MFIFQISVSGERDILKFMCLKLLQSMCIFCHFRVMNSPLLSHVPSSSIDNASSNHDQVGENQKNCNSRRVLQAMYICIYHQRGEFCNNHKAL
jgi:hypothetical protein